MGAIEEMMCVVSSAADVLWMSVVRGMRSWWNVYVFGLGRRGGDWMRGLGLGFSNPVGTWGVLEVCLCLVCGGVGGEWVGASDQSGIMSV